MSTLKVTNIQDTSGGNSATTEQIYKGIAKAWVNFNGTLAAPRTFIFTSSGGIRASFNVSSITYDGVGNYTVNFTTAMVDANYCWSVSGQRGDDATIGMIGAFGTTGNAYTSATTTSFRARTTNTNGVVVDYLAVTVAIFR